MVLLYLFARIDLRAKQVETKGALTTALSGPILVTLIRLHRVAHLADKRASLSNRTAACLIVETFASEELTRTWIRSRQYSGRMTGLRSGIPRSSGAWRSSSRIILSMCERSCCRRSSRLMNSSPQVLAFRPPCFVTVTRSLCLNACQTDTTLSWPDALARCGPQDANP